jgi:hypothetical protein
VSIDGAPAGEIGEIGAGPDLSPDASLGPIDGDGDGDGGMSRLWWAAAPQDVTVPARFWTT